MSGAGTVHHINCRHSRGHHGRAVSWLRSGEIRLLLTRGYPVVINGLPGLLRQFKSDGLPRFPLPDGCPNRPHGRSTRYRRPSVQQHRNPAACFDREIGAGYHRTLARVSCIVRTRGATGLSWLRFAPNFADEGVEGRREKKTKAGHAQHSKEHGRAQRLPHLGSSSGRHHQRSNAEDERE